MSIDEVDAATVRHSSGAEIGGIDRTTMYYERDGRRLVLAVERGTSYGFTLPPVARWSDGAPVTEVELGAVEKALVEACRHWGVTAEFFRIDPTAPGPDIDEIVARIQQSRPAARRD